MPTVEELLTASRAAHLEYRRSLPRMANVRGASKPLEQAGDPVAARAALERAADLRAQADAADPDRNDGAWATDEAAFGNHDAIMAFYADVVARPLPADALRAARQPAKGATDGRR